MGTANHRTKCVIFHSYNVRPPSYKLVYKPQELVRYKYHKPKLLELFEPT